MSRIGNKPVAIPSGVKVDIAGNKVTVSGSKGSLHFSHPHGVNVKVENDAVAVGRESDLAKHRAFHGLTRSLINNMIQGVSQGYQQRMEVFGTGYGCDLKGQTLVLTVGFSHTVDLPVPEGIKVTIEVAQARGDETPAKLLIEGIDKQVVGQFARNVKDARPPEPYKGKGIRYEGEQIIRKDGKAFAGAGS